jgi:hypothetical protein
MDMHAICLELVAYAFYSLLLYAVRNCAVMIQQHKGAQQRPPCNDCYLRILGPG